MQLYQTNQNKWKNIMETKKAIKGRIIDTITPPDPKYHCITYYRDCGNLICNNRSTPERYLTPRQHITNKTSRYYQNQNNNPTSPKKAAGVTKRTKVLTTKYMKINHNKKKTCTICMYIPQQPTMRNITHDMLY